MRICWNAIVRNEAARIERCMESLIHHIDCAVILDTGSTDDTPAIIEAFFAAHGKPVDIQYSQFVNFEQARNEALMCARASVLEWDYLLLCDADMQLCVTGKFPPGINGAAYQMLQRAGSTLEYYNVRMLARHSKARYIGVTHEYLNVPEGVGMIHPDDAMFLDHADGANRTDKFERDIKLLKDALEQEPSNERYWFYLGQSYRDAGYYALALHAYKKRVELGGWPEEQWNAQVNVATCHKSLLQENDFVAAMLEAHEMRPQRAEALYDLARYYREKGKNRLAALFAKKACETPLPKDDVLFINKYVYDVGAKEELSIAAFYDPATRAEGFRACNSVALGVHGSSSSTNQARANLFHYLPTASQVLPSIWFTRIQPDWVPEGWTLLNPSIAKLGRNVHCILRMVNYRITPEGRYDIDGKGSDISADNPIRTRNFMACLDGALQVQSSKEIHAPERTEFPLVRGWEDMRLYPLRGGFWVSATVREANAPGRCEQWVGMLTEEGHGVKLLGARRMPSFQENEKNWMPIVAGTTGNWLHSIGVVVDENGVTRQTNGLLFNAEHIRGSSQVIPFRSGFLAVVHEASYRPNGQRYYFHRFVFFDVDMNVRNVSLPFVFHDKQIEFCAGMCAHPDGKHLLISFGVQDKEAWVGTASINDVAEFVFQ